MIHVVGITNGDGEMGSVYLSKICPHLQVSDRVKVVHGRLIVGENFELAKLTNLPLARNPNIVGTTSITLTG